MSRATQENIQRLLDLTGVTHERLSEIAGLSRSAVTQWVIGKSDPRMGPLQRIADYFGLTTNNLADPGGMMYVYMGADGRLREDLPAKIRDLKEKIARMEASTFDSKAFSSYEMALRDSSSTQYLTRDEREILRMYRSLDDNGRKVARITMASYSKSGMFEK